MRNRLHMTNLRLFVRTTGACVEGTSMTLSHRPVPPVCDPPRRTTVPATIMISTEKGGRTAASVYPSTAIEGDKRVRCDGVWQESPLAASGLSGRRGAGRGRAVRHRRLKQNQARSSLVGDAREHQIGPVVQRTLLLFVVTTCVHRPLRLICQGVRAPLPPLDSKPCLVGGQGFLIGGVEEARSRSL